METATEIDLSARDRAILRAVDTGNAEFILGAEPDLLLDGRFCGDQAAARRLLGAGLIAPAAQGAVAQRVPAQVTAAGARALPR